MNMKILLHVNHPLRTKIFNRLYQPFAQPKRTLINALNRDLIATADNVAFHKNLLKPIVALESALYTHLMLYPDNFELARHLQNLIRGTGATPATIGVINGVAKIGLSDQEIHTLCIAAGKLETLKISRNDLSFALGTGIAGSPVNGGTTISSTMTLARWAGINVLATSGLGDVHLGGENPLSISADVTELGRTPIAIVSGGCRNFLDTRRTLELLETNGVLVATYSDGRAANINFPEFYSRDSGIKSPRVFHDYKEAAAIIFSLAKLGTRANRFSRSGVLFANPVSENFSIPRDEIKKATFQAIDEVSNLKIHEHEAARFALNKIRDLTNGRSNIVSLASIESNVILASKIAVELASFWKKDLGCKESLNLNISGQNTKIVTEKSKLKSENYGYSNFAHPRISKHIAHSNDLYEAKVNALKTNDTLGLNIKPNYHPNIVIIGAVVIEQTCDFILSPNAAFDTNLQPSLRSLNHSRIEHTVGGVGHDIALAAHLVSGDQRVRLCSLVANDLSGSTTVESLKAETLDIHGIKVLPKIINRSGQDIQNRTAHCVLINDGKKDLVLGMTDMQIFRHNSYECSNIITENLKWAVIDANWNRKTVRGLMSMMRNKCPWTKIAFAPSSEQKGADIFRTSSNPESSCEIPNALDVYPNHKIDLAALSVGELNEMFCAATSHGYFENNDHWHVLDAFGIMGTQSNDRYKAIAGHELTIQGVPFQTIQLLPYIPKLLIKLGSKGVLLTELLKIGDSRLKDNIHEKWIVSRTRSGHMYIGGVYMRLYPIVETVDPADILSSKGAGNTLLGILIAGLSRGLKLDKNLVDIAQKGAIMTLRCKQAVSPSLGELTQSLDRLALNSENLENQVSKSATSLQSQQGISQNDENNQAFNAPIYHIRNFNFESEKYRNQTETAIENNASVTAKYGLPPL